MMDISMAAESTNLQKTKLKTIIWVIISILIRKFNIAFWSQVSKVSINIESRESFCIIKAA